LDQESPTNPTDTSQLLLHSNGCNRWFDKSVQFIIFANGKSGLNMEHAGFDGTTLINLAQFVHTNAQRNGNEKRGFLFDSKLNELEFQSNSDLEDLLRKSKLAFNKLCARTET